VFFQDLRSRIDAVPGLHATYGPSPAAGFGGRFVAFGRETQATAPSGLLSIYFVEADYFAVTGIPMKAGRFFSDAEALSGLAVGVIDERAAVLHWPGQSAIDQRFRYSPNAPWITVVGIASHVKTRSFTAANGTVQVYVPARLNALVPLRQPLLVRRESDAVKASAAIRSIVTGIDPAVQLEDESPVTALYDDVFAEPRFFAALMTVFAGLALLTASVGLYALVRYAVTQRTREIGVRIALGANLHRIVRLVLRDAFVPIGVGLAAGTAASWWLSRFLSSLLYGISPHDPVTLALVTAVLVGVAFLAAYLPARRATHIDPIVTLRAE
jgi:ABC-type antimicrobial peptide transport system permease subunit